MRRSSSRRGTKEKERGRTKTRNSKQRKGEERIRIKKMRESGQKNIIQGEGQRLEKDKEREEEIERRSGMVNE